MPFNDGWNDVPVAHNDGWSDVPTAQPKGIQQRDPFSYSKADTEKMQADFVASEGGNVFKGIPNPGQQVDTRRISYTGDQGAGESIQNATIGLGAGMYKVGKGIQQLSGKTGAAVGIPGAAGLEQSAKADRLSAAADFAPLRRESTAAKVGEFIGEVVPFIALPGGVAGGAVKRAVTAGLSGAGMGAVMEPDEPLSGAAKGAALGAGSSAVLSGIGKVANAAMGKLPANANRELSDKFKVPLTLSEEAGGVGSKTDTLMEQVPSVFGIKGFRQEQQQAAKDAATTHFSKYVFDPSLDSTAAMKVANDAHLDDLYQTVRANAASIPQAAAPEVKAAATELLGRYPAVFETIQDTKIKKILANIADDTATKSKTIDVMDDLGRPITTPGVGGGGHGGPKPVAVSLLDASGKPIRQKIEPKFSLDDLWTLRKGIGQAMGGARTPTETAQLSRVYAAVSDDMDGMLAVDVGGKAMRDFRAANDAFKQYSVKFDAMREAYDKAVGTTGASEVFSPKKYSTMLKNLANDPRYKKNVKWSDGEVEEMTGLANILQVAKRAGQFTENPPTGNRWGMPSLAASAGGGSFLAGGAAATAQTAGASAASALLVKFITTTRAGKNLALSASKLNPEGPGMRRLMDQLYNQLPKTAVVAGEVEGYEEGGAVTDGGTVTFNDTTAEGIANTDKAMSGGMGGGYGASVIHYEAPAPTPAAATSPPVQAAAPVPPAASSPAATTTPALVQSAASIQPAATSLSASLAPIPALTASPSLTQGYGSFSVEGGPKVGYEDIGTASDPYASSSMLAKAQKRTSPIGSGITPRQGFAAGGMVLGDNAPSNLRHSIIWQGKQYIGAPGQGFKDFLGTHKIGLRQKWQRGFVTSDGRFLNPDQVEGYVKSVGGD